MIVVSLDTALAANKLGYKEYTSHVYAETLAHSMYDCRRSEDVFFDYIPPRPLPAAYVKDETVEVCKCPSLDELAKWVRLTYGIHIEILLSETSPYDKFYYRETTIGKYFVLSHDDEYYITPEEALDMGLRKTLNKIINEKRSY